MCWRNLWIQRIQWMWVLSILLRRKHDMRGAPCLPSTLPLCHVSCVEGHSSQLLRMNAFAYLWERIWTCSGQLPFSWCLLNCVWFVYRVELHSCVFKSKTSGSHVPFSGKYNLIFLKETIGWPAASCSQEEWLHGMQWTSHSTASILCLYWTMKISTAGTHPAYCKCKTESPGKRDTISRKTVKSRHSCYKLKTSKMPALLRLCWYQAMRWFLPRD